MTEQPPQKFFYDTDFWKTSHGLQLWQQRLLNACLTHLNQNTNYPFFITFLSESETDHGGYFAEWTSRDSVLNIEIEGHTLSLFMATVTPSADNNPEGTNQTDLTSTMFYYGNPEDPESESWDELPAGLEATRLWFEQAYAENPDDQITAQDRLRKLVEHLK